MTSSSAWSLRVDSNWVDLFNGEDFTGWYSYVVPPSSSPATYQSPADDPGKNFQIIDTVIVHDVNPAVKQTSCYLMTKKSYSRYHFRVDYKLGNDCASNVTYCKNSGLLYCHIEDGVWGVGIESNMYFDWPTALAPLTGSKKTSFASVRSNFDNFGTEADKMNDYTTDGEWNTMEVKVWADSAVEQWVNGHLGGWATGIKQPNGQPLTEGRIGLQGEGNDVSFRNPQIRLLDDPIKYWGCTDTNAENYEEEATHDDSSCIVTVKSTPGPIQQINGVTITSQEVSVSHPKNFNMIFRDITGSITNNISGMGPYSFDLSSLEKNGIHLVTISIDGISTSGIVVNY
ncbi:MAG: DUF1080 domain-containing protein [Fibrobacteria bacterium]|nr:DUF1080 domain-containing protein [Fibrobacteria bacterium]